MNRLVLDRETTYQTFDRFGVSGAWWAQVVGGWEETDEASGLPKRERVAQLLFDPVKGMGNYSGTVKKTYTITKQPLVASNITLSWTSKAYNGSVQKPTVTVKSSHGTTISEGGSYTLTWSGDCKAAGTYTVTITGAGKFTGTVKKTYTITKQELDASRVTLSKTSFTYNGSVQQPKVTVKSAAGNILTEGGSYVVSYSAGCKAKGTYTVFIMGEGNYTGTVTKTFTIK